MGDVAFSQLQRTGSYLLVRVTRKKTRQEHSVSVFPSVLQWKTDPLHALTVQLATDPFNLSERVFSQINFEISQHDNITAYISRLFESLSGVPDITPNLKSHSSRRGSATLAASNHEVNLSDLARCGRWTMDGFNTLLEYIAETSNSDQKAAHVLGVGKPQGYGAAAQARGWRSHGRSPEIVCSCSLPAVQDTAQV